ncbi:S-adenosyl-L-methionine-dependent methyltransferase [Hypoxylon sp. FL1150]|nr:S-adenosyl-L-methionine-dependent methyltransferase [Hypoxylon sp. FL1150]
MADHLNDRLRRKKPLPQNPIVAAITLWFQSSTLAQQQQQDLNDLVAQAPKRWTVYEPMVLLPAGSFGTVTWKQILSSPSGEDVDGLWVRVLKEISKRTGGGTPLTHLAVNEGIPAVLQHKSAAEERSSNGGTGVFCRDDGGRASDNILRSPTGLRILHGDFGPASSFPSSVCDATPGPGPGPDADDFARAFWVSTRQNGVFQTWAPRWTMFSRGNIKEKARLLDFHRNSTDKTTTAWENAWAVDLYAGIGYFTFSYAKLGMRVLCWELNPWSVEGLRRGAVGNGWSVKVVKGEDELTLPMHELFRGGERVVVFLEDNGHAARRIKELSSLNILHINCGLLPTSDASWRDAWGMAVQGESDEAWLHLHENVGVADIDGRAKDIEQYFLDLAREDGSQKTAHVVHTEQVKTFAPGVWHCVFDLHITRSSSIP